jgi:hypothetical protein
MTIASAQTGHARRATPGRAIMPLLMTRDPVFYRTMTQDIRWATGGRLSHAKPQRRKEKWEYRLSRESFIGMHFLCAFAPLREIFQHPPAKWS